MPLLDGLGGGVLKAYAVNGELTAFAACSMDMKRRKWKVTLIKKNGSWDWAPRKECPSEMPVMAAPVPGPLAGRPSDAAKKR